MIVPRFIKFWIGYNAFLNYRVSLITELFQ